MNPAEARALLREQLAPYRALSFSELCALLPASPLIGDRLAPSGTRYQIEVRLAWVGPAGGAVRVAGTIDDSGWRAPAPVREEFVVRPDPPAPRGGARVTRG
jgi:hypothetical protein